MRSHEKVLRVIADRAENRCAVLGAKKNRLGNYENGEKMRDAGRWLTLIDVCRAGVVSQILGSLKLKPCTQPRVVYQSPSDDMAPSCRLPGQISHWFAR